MSLPVLLGGSPIRPGGPPTWPPRTDAIGAVLESLQQTGDWGRYHGPHGGKLAEALGVSHRTEHVQLCSSGTASVELALRGVQVGPGDEVILSAYDFKANFTNIALLGATPVLVDCRDDDAQLDVAAVEAALTEKTKAIIASHLQGGLVDMPALRELADRRGIAIIEDACQSPGAMIAGRIAGSWGDVATLSFGGSKLVTAGRGGAVLTNRPEIAQRMRVFNQRGNEAYPLSEIQAALLLPQWLVLEEQNAIRTETVESLRDLPGLLPWDRLPACLFAEDDRLEAYPTGQTSGERQPVYYKVGFWYDGAAYENLPRERFCQALRAEGFAFDPGFPGLHQTHARRRFRVVDELPNATRACASVVMLHHPILLEGPTLAPQLRAALDKIRTHARMLRDAVIADEPC